MFENGFILDLLHTKGNSILIGISGIDNAGKSSYATKLKKDLESLNKKVSIITLDVNMELLNECKFYKNPSKFYYEHFINENELLLKINNEFINNDIVLLVGCLIFKNDLILNFDYKIWIDCTFTTSINRGNIEMKPYLSDILMWVGRQHFSIDNPKFKVDEVIINDPLIESGAATLVDSHDESTLLKMKWLNEPNEWIIKDNNIYVKTNAITDFWQRTHYGFRNDNAHMFYIETNKDFEITTNVSFKPVHQFDQCGLVVRIDEDNWIKTSIEYELNNPPKLGAVVTNLGYSDWSTEEMAEIVNEAEFKIIREGNDYTIMVKTDKRGFRQLRICHLHDLTLNVMVGVYCCSPINNGYEVNFSDLKIKERLY